MSSRLTDLLSGAALAAFSVASFGAAIGNLALFAYSSVGGFLLGICGQGAEALRKGRRRHYDPVLSGRWNGVLMATDIIFVSLLLLRLTLDFRVPEPVYGLGAAAGRFDRLPTASGVPRLVVRPAAGAAPA